MKLSQLQFDHMAHAIGIDDWEMTRRNRYYASPFDGKTVTSWEALVSAGYAEIAGDSDGVEEIVYQVTKAGRAVLLEEAIRKLNEFLGEDRPERNGDEPDATG